MGCNRTYFVCILVVLSLLASAGATTRRRRARTARPAAVHHAVVRRTAIRRSVHHMRHLVWHPLFAGSHEMLVRQNVQLDMMELPRIANEDELNARELAEELVPVEDTEGLTIAANLKENRRYCKPWTRDFLEDLGEAYYQEFHHPIIATSLVRTAEQQKKLRRHNHNAAPQEGDTASTHLAGVTVDLLKRGMTKREHDWVEQYFVPLVQAGFIEPIEERRQPVFHVVVFKSYSDSRYVDPLEETAPPTDTIQPTQVAPPAETPVEPVELHDSNSSD